MVTIELHRAVYIQILRAIYSDPILRTALGFKGGTAALLFYELPRFSVDLDFDLLDPDKKLVVFTRLKAILPSFGTVKEGTEKHFTLFFLINYRKGERNLKIEISKRPGGSSFTPMTHLGITMLVMTKEDMTANKLAALLTRKKFASRDLFDVWFFLKNQWPLNRKLFEGKTGITLYAALNRAIRQVSSLKKTDILSGLGELLDEKQKSWAKDHIIEDAIFQLRLYRSSTMTNRTN